MSGNEGLVAVITGASRGLGAGLAEAFAADGLRLGLCARTRPEVPLATADAIVEVVDVADAAAVDRFGATVTRRFGRIDVWINNAGLLEPIGPLATADPGAFRVNVEVNLLGTFHGTATFVRHVRSRSGPGVLVNIVSGAASRPYEGWSAYCASKAGVAMLTEVIAEEEREHGLAAFALSPGVVDTSMQELVRQSSPEVFPEGDRFRRLFAEGRLSSPLRVARFMLDRLVAPAMAGRNDSPVRIRVPD